MSKIENQVKMLQRAELGKNKYGVTMEREDLTELEWLTHAQEEAMDLSIYLQKCINKKHEESNN